jgi:hypothetical protein
VKEGKKIFFSPKISKLLATAFVFLWGTLVWAVLEYLSPASPSPSPSTVKKNTLGNENRSIKLCMPRHGHTVVELNNGKILIMSGHTSEGFIDAPSNLTGTAEIIDLSIKKSKLIGSLREPRADAMAVAFGRKSAILFGGHGRWLEGDDSFLELLNSDLPPIGRDAAT